ncbi:hypothetical protein B0I35DRAFT_364447, partial [Stachybotrys elegans]
PNQSPEGEKIYCMLVLDELTGYIDLCCAKYCIVFNIVVARSRAHSIHLM